VRCVFFGSPDFALGSLEALLHSRHSVVGIVTQPDRPAGRGLKLEPPAVKKRALAAGLPILQPEKVNCDDTYRFLDELKPEILVVVAYGGFLGKKLLEPRPFPPVNVHPSLLPDLRGAAPIQWALLRGYAQTGVTTQFMVKEMDAGDVLLQEIFAVGEAENSRDLHDRLSREGGRLIVNTLDGLENGSLTPKPQDGAKATFAPLLTKEDGLLHFRRDDAWTCHNKVRGLYPWPGAYAFLNKTRVRVLRSLPAKEIPARGAPGSIWLEGEHLFVNCRGTALELLELQPEGRRATLPREFENGMKSAGLPYQFDESGGES
jgi:methionyl-tRNA formyltransferase